MPVTSFEGLIRASLDRISGGSIALTKSALRTLATSGVPDGTIVQTLHDKGTGKLLIMCGLTKCGHQDYVAGK